MSHNKPDPQIVKAAEEHAKRIVESAMAKAMKETKLRQQPKKVNPHLAKSLAGAKGRGGTKEFKPNELKAIKDKKYGLQSKLHHERLKRGAGESKADFVKRAQGKVVTKRGRSSLGGGAAAGGKKK